MIDKKKSCTGKLTTKKLQRDLNPKKKKGEKNTAERRKSFLVFCVGPSLPPPPPPPLEFCCLLLQNTKNKHKK
jgi:hypothetical protein